MPGGPMHAAATRRLSSSSRRVSLPAPKSPGIVSLQSMSGFGWMGIFARRPQQTAHAVGLSAANGTNDFGETLGAECGDVLLGRGERKGFAASVSPRGCNRSSHDVPVV